MNSRTRFFAVSLVLSVVAVSLGGVAAASEYKIGIVDLQKVMDAYDLRRERVGELEQEFEGIQESLNQVEENFTREKESYEAVRDTLSEAERARRETDLESMFIDLQTQFRRADAELEAKKARLKRELLGNMLTAIAEIGAAENYHMILEADPESRSGVLYFSATMDISTRVIEHLNSGAGRAGQGSE